LRRFLFGGDGGASRLADLGLLLLRVLAGLGLALGHGRGKLPPTDGFVGRVADLGFPVPELFAWGAGLAEFAGGLLVVLGLLTRPAALAASVVMATAFFGAHAGSAFTGGAEAAFLYGAVMLALLLTGAGRFSLDAALERRRGAYVDRFRRR
jgi:putative oxidoreductase